MRSRITIDLGALRRNARTLLRALGGSELWAVVKANGYGHGARDCAAAALDAGATRLCVATLAEALELRRARSGPLSMRETSSYVIVPATRAWDSARTPCPMSVTGAPAGSSRGSSTANASIEIVPTTRHRSPPTRTSVPVRSRRNPSA